MANKKIEAVGDGVVLPRLKKHRDMLADILMDSRISGNRRILGAFLAIWMDLYEKPELQERFLKLIEGIFGNPSGRAMKWGDDDLNEKTTNLDAATAEQTEKLKNIFASALSGDINGGEYDALSTPKLHSSGNGI